jgi:hypothetical protein
MKNNEPARPARAPISPDIANLRRDAVWKGDELYLRRRLIAQVAVDKKYPQMWRVRLPNGQLSDMVNKTRAKDAALWLASLSAD